MTGIRILPMLQSSMLATTPRETPTLQIKRMTNRWQEHKTYKSDRFIYMVAEMEKK